MHIKLFYIPAFFLLSLIACSPGTRNTGSPGLPAAGEPSPGKEIPFTVARNYFLNNTYQSGDLANPVIRSQGEFEKYFGVARTMGPDGKPTPVDFSTHYVIAAIAAETSYKTTMSVRSLSRENDSIVLRYQITRGDKLSAVIQPVLLLVVSREYTGDVVLKEE